MHNTFRTGLPWLERGRGLIACKHLYIPVSVICIVSKLPLPVSDIHQILVSIRRSPGYKYSGRAFLPSRGRCICCTGLRFAWLHPPGLRQTAVRRNDGDDPASWRRWIAWDSMPYPWRAWSDIPLVSNRLHSVSTAFLLHNRMWVEVAPTYFV